MKNKNPLSTVTKEKIIQGASVVIWVQSIHPVTLVIFKGIFLTHGSGSRLLTRFSSQSQLLWLQTQSELLRFLNPIQLNPPTRG